MALYQVTFILLGHDTAWAVTIGGVPGYNTTEAEYTARALLQAQHIATVGDLLSAEEQPPGSAACRSVELIP
jgi:hypothetical protein